MLGSRKGPPPTPTYTLSGTITGDVVEGVTITLTGDASDSTTTAVDGTYSFTGLVDGDYVVTPTYTNLQMAPVSSAVEISGGDETGVDFVAQYLLLPFTYDMSNLSGSAGDAISGTAGWSKIGDEDFKVSTTIADKNSYSPAGVTKVAWGDSLGNSKNINSAYALPYQVQPGITTTRFAALMRAATDSRGSGWVQAIGEDVASGFFQSVRNSSAQVFLNAIYTDGGAAQTEMNFPAVTGNIGDGTAPSGNEWVWLRVEFNWIADTVYVGVVKAQTGNGKYTQVSMSAAGQAAGGLFEVLSLALRNNDTANAAYDAYFAKLWIGTASDDWPV
jgi:hypothetical protein